MLLETEGLKVPTDGGLLRDMAQSPLQFYLTGSHYFGCSHADSDVDWFVQYSEDALIALERLGFTRKEAPPGTIEAGYSLNADTHSIWEKVTPHYAVQVQAVFDVHLKRRVRDFMRSHFPLVHRDAGRKERMMLWTKVRELLEFRPKAWPGDVA